MKKTIRIICALLAVTLLLPIISLADAQPQRIKDFWVSPDGSLSPDAIRWYLKGSTYYLFLPYYLNPDELCVGFSGTAHIAVDGENLSLGDLFPYDEAKESYTLSCGEKKYNLQIMRGSQGLPALYITTASGNLEYIHKKKSNKEAGTLLFIDPKGTAEYNGNLTHIKIRGNSSTTFKKKNYQIKLEKGANLMDMGKCRTWILTGNFRDKSLLRNQITMDMAMYAGMHGTPEHISADLYINNDYMGTYLFSEKVMIDDDRIDIHDLESETEDMNDKDLSEYKLVGERKPAPGKYKAYNIPVIPVDITGGYLVEFEIYSSRYSEEASAYYTKRNNTLVVKSPEYCSEEQMKYISSFMQSFENAIFSKDGTDPVTGKHYTEIMDMDSLVRKYMIEEIAKNYDGNNSSMFFYKPEDSKSTLGFAGPVWDYDSAYGSYAREDNQKRVLPPTGFWIKNASGRSYWWPALAKQPDFDAAVKETWNSTFSSAMKVLMGEETDETGTLRSVDEYVEQINDSAQMNFIRWPIPKNPTTVAQMGNSFEKNITYLKNFISKRFEFLDSQWGEK